MSIEIGQVRPLRPGAHSAERPDARSGSGYSGSLPLDERTLEILERRRLASTIRRRGWLVRRMLLAADLTGLTIAYAGAELIVGSPASRLGRPGDLLIFLALLPAWVVLAKLFGLYEHDEERTEFSTVDELGGVLNFVTLGTWLSFALAFAFVPGEVSSGELIAFWALAVGTVLLGRSTTRAFCRRRLAYLQNTVIVGAGDVGQLVARKFLQHPEYGINLVGFVDDRPKARGSHIGDLALLGPPSDLREIVRALDVERVVVAYSNETPEQLVSLVRSLNDQHVQIDVVPRLFEVVAPSGRLHDVEGLALIGLPPVRLSRSSRLIKRTIDITGAALGLVILAPLFVVVAVLIKRDSPGPVFFRQTRLGMDQHPFTLLKFRTMRDGTDQSEHLDFIKATLDPSVAPTSNGLYKPERLDAVTGVGRWLRRTSLDGLPQLINILLGDMSLVGPRPCLPEETQFFAPHHFERFLVPAGLTGLWQVTARAHSTFAEALDLDAAYVRSWSLRLDFSLVLRTVRRLLLDKGTA